MARVYQSDPEKVAANLRGRFGAGVELERVAECRSWLVMVMNCHCSEGHVAGEAFDTLFEDYDDDAATDEIARLLLRRRCDNTGEPIVIDGRIDGLDGSMARAMGRNWPRAFVKLTPAQLAAARRAWSTALLNKRVDAEEKERCRVVVDIQEIE